MARAPVESRFTQALDALVERVKKDRSVVAAILCGSLSHDKVWAKSDIDLVLLTIDFSAGHRSPMRRRGGAVVL
jgi:predicted nucleotidyltransferase